MFTRLTSCHFPRILTNIFSNYVDILSKLKYKQRIVKNLLLNNTLLMIPQINTHEKNINSCFFNVMVQVTFTAPSWRRSAEVFT